MSHPNPPAPERRIARTLTQKYDMHALRILQKLEAEILQEYSETLGVEEDEVPVELDLLHVYNADASLRKTQLDDMFKDVPIDNTETIEKILAKMEEIDESHHQTGHSH